MVTEIEAIVLVYKTHYMPIRNVGLKVSVSALQIVRTIKQL